MSAPANTPLRAAIVPVTPIEQNCTLIWCTATMKALGPPPTIPSLSFRIIPSLVTGTPP